MFKDMFKKSYTVIGRRSEKKEAADAVETIVAPQEENAQAAGSDGAAVQTEAAAPAAGAYVMQERTIREARRAGMTQEEIKELWKRCNKCERPILVEDVINNHYICPECGSYFRVHADRRIEMLVDEGTFEEWDSVMEDVNPLDFPGYEKKVADAREKTGMNEAIIIGKGKICGQDTVIGVCDSRFLMSSMGHNVGEKITRAVERATAERLPVILYATSGGARMQEGMISLMQMAKTAAALKRHSEAGLLYISVLTDPTTGGVTASFAMLGDIILAEPGALIGFAGPRVIEQTIHQKLPEGFQRAEFLLEHGFVDQIVERKDQKKVLGRLLKLHGAGQTWESWNEETNASANGLTSEVFQSRTAGIQSGNAGGKLTSALSETASRLLKVSPMKSRKAPFSGMMRQKTLDKIAGRQQDAWDAVRCSRSAGRLVASDYIRILFDEYCEMHGDRYFGDDGAIIGGVASFYGMPVTVIGQERGKNPKDSMKRNFGMPSPEGYRKALRLMKQAEKFGRPIICFVDTPGAFPGMEAEERGQGEAIARNLFEMSDLKVPVLTLITGQGGSGGALALAVSNEVWMMENATYSILSPEGFASILWKDAQKAAEAAKVMKITAKDLYDLGMIERIISEDQPAGEENLELIGQIIDKHMREFFKSCAERTQVEIVNQRYDRFRRI